MHNRSSLPVSYQGEPGAYSEMAVHSVFPGLSTLPRKTFRDAFDSLRNGTAQAALLPVENSLTGSVHENYDLLLEYDDMHIIGETQIRVSHCLLATSAARLDTVKTVLSHPQALLQSSVWLDRHPTWVRQPFYDTAGSAAYVAAQKDPCLAAIAGVVAAETYGLKILAKAIETNPYNFTRFFVVARNDHPSPHEPNKTSIVFTLGTEAGSLAKVLTILAGNGYNLTKLESRPIHGKPWQYMFYADMELNSNLAVFEATMGQVAEYAADLRLLGHYQSTLISLAAAPPTV